MLKQYKLSMLAILLVAVMVLFGCDQENKEEMRERVTKEKELYKQQFQTQLDEWRMDIAKLKLKASAAKDEAHQTMMKEQVEKLDKKIQEADKKLSEVLEASEDKWDSAKKSTESFWESAKSTFKDTLSKFKED